MPVKAGIKPCIDQSNAKFSIRDTLITFYNIP
jgi:hypothetical protein